MAKKKGDKEDSKLQLQPLGDRVVVQREESEEKTPGGIVLPDTAKKRPSRGVVVCVGPGRMLEDGTRAPMQINVGDRVLFSAYAGDDFKIGDQELVLLREEDILAVIE
jgi:chaperonin GroES